MEKLAVARQDAVFVEVRGGRDLAIKQVDADGTLNVVVVRLTNLPELCEAMQKAAAEG